VAAEVLNVLRMGEQELKKKKKERETLGSLRS
jgi:hypothetical protein